LTVFERVILETKKTILLFDKPAPKSLIWHFAGFLGGGVSALIASQGIFAILRFLETDSSADYSVYAITAVFSFATPFFIWYNLRAWFRPRRLFLTQDAIWFGGFRFISAAKRFNTDGPARIDFSENYRFRAMKDPWTKGIGFFIETKDLAGNWTSFEILSHCKDPRAIAKKINSMIENMGYSAKPVVMSKALEKYLYPKHRKVVPRKSKALTPRARSVLRVRAKIHIAL